MRIITESKLRDFWVVKDAGEGSRREKSMRAWIAVLRRAKWENFFDVRETFNHADVYGKCTIFDIGGNKYRVVATVAFGIGVVYIRAVLTHAECNTKDWQPDCK